MNKDNSTSKQHNTKQNKILIYEKTLGNFTKHRQKGDTNNTEHMTDTTIQMIQMEI